MRAREFVSESTSPNITIRDAKRALSAMGFKPTGRGKGSHDVWKDPSGLLFTIPVHGKDLEYGVAKTLLKLIRSRQTELEEMAGEIHGGVRKALMSKGYRYLGSGIDKQAYLEPGTGQVLIVFGYRKGVTDFSPDQRMFIDWIDYCNKNKGNPHLPRFSGFESFQFQGKNYIQARMERLNEVPARIKELVSYLDHAADHMGTNDLGAALKRLSSFAGNWDEEADEFKYDTVEQIVDFLGGTDRAADLLNTVHQVKEFSQQHGYSLDLHSGNYMQRANGTIVVNDPFVLWLNQ